MAARLRAGDRVALSGLAGRAELNGRHGKVVRYVQESSRWKVVLDGASEDSSVALKPANLEALPAHGEGFARTVLAAIARSDAPRRVRTVHVLGASVWELKLQYRALLEVAALRVGDCVALNGLTKQPELNGSQGVLERYIAEKGRWRVRLDSQTSDEGYVLKPENLTPIPAYRDEGLHGAWLQDGDRHVLRGTRVYGPDGDNVEEVQIMGDICFSMAVEGETFMATLGPDGQKLVWSDGDAWVRPAPEQEALLRIVLIGPELPASYPEGALTPVDPWGEPGVHVSCFRGTYEAFAASPSFSAAELAVLASPGLAPLGRGPAYFQWAPALRALAAGAAAASGAAAGAPPPLCISTGAEPCGEGEWLGDAITDVLVLEALGFEVSAPPERSPHGGRLAKHPVCGWNMWAFTLLFRWPEGATVAPLEEWTWGGYYRARRAPNELPRYRFRPCAPEFKPAVLDEEEPARGDDAALMQRNNAIHVAVMEWVGSTAQRAWLRGGAARPAAAAAAEATAACEEFGESLRSQPVPKEQEQQMIAAVCEAATRAAAATDGGGALPGVAVAAAITVYEALAHAALWRKEGLEPDMVGHVVLACVQAAELRLESGVASAVGERATEVYSQLRGLSRPPRGRLGEELAKLVEGVCATAGADAETQKAVAQAVVDNLDLAIPAHGGQEASLRISKKMHDAPSYYKDA